MNLKKHLSNLRKLSIQEDRTKGYAGSPKKYIDPFLPRFKVIIYKKGPYTVVDRYTGQEQNVGQAITFYKKKPIYGVNYYGKMLVKRPMAEIVFEFLKQALRAGAGKSIHRGPKTFKKDNFSYSNQFKEKYGFVEGEEKIFFKNKLVYRQVYHSGLIEDQRSYKEWARHLLALNKLKSKLKYL